MERIESFAQAINYLKDKEILLSYDDNIRTIYYYNSGSITIKTDKCRYKVSLEQFKQLFSKTIFYLYIPTDETVNIEKDNEYYSWKSKGTN